MHCTLEPLILWAYYKKRILVNQLKFATISGGAEGKYGLCAGQCKEPGVSGLL